MAQKRKKTSKTTTRSSKKSNVRLNADELEHFKTMLLEKRMQLVGDVNEIHDEALKKPRIDAAGDLSSMPIHMADLGSDNFEQEFALGLMDSERKLLKEIDDALIRIDNGTYGICEVTDKSIAKARLEAKPWARYSVAYARKLEQGLVQEQ